MSNGSQPNWPSFQGQAVLVGTSPSVSTGEALSRWCAAGLRNNALADFATAPTWFNDGSDFVSQTDPTDQNRVSAACGMAFISWLLSQQIGLGTIAQGLVAPGAGGDSPRLASAAAPVPPVIADGRPAESPMARAAFSAARARRRR